MVLMAGLVTLTVTLAPSASAHATVGSTDPADGSRLAAAPSAVTVTFDESVGLDLGYLKVIDAQGTEVDDGPASHPGGAGQVIGIDLKPGLGDGTYIVSWRVISADSHPVEGSIRFLVGNGVLSTAAVATAPVVDAGTSIAFDVARAVSYGALAVLGGGWLLLTLWPGGRRSRKARRVLVIGWILLVVGAIAETLLQGAYAGGTGLGGIAQVRLLSNTVSTNYGRMHLLRILLLAGVGVVLDNLFHAEDAPLGRRRCVPPVLLFVAVVFTFSESGHAGVATPRWLALTSDMAHLTAMSAWIGGLVLLVVVLLPRRRPGELATVLPVFSRVAFVSVLVIAVTGTYQAWRESGTVRAIETTTYGRLVLVKVALFIGLVLLGNISRLAIQRRYVRRALPDAGEQAMVDIRPMRRSVLVELVLAAAVLSVSGVLVSQAPGRVAVVNPAPPPVSATTSLSAGQTVTVTVSPAHHGIVTIRIAVHGGTKPRTVLATASLTAEQLGPLPIALSPPAGSGTTWTYTADGVLLPAAGRWSVDLVVTASEFDATTATLPVDIS